MHITWCIGLEFLTSLCQIYAERGQPWPSTDNCIFQWLLDFWDISLSLFFVRRKCGFLSLDQLSISLPWNYQGNWCLNQCCLGSWIKGLIWCHRVYSKCSLYCPLLSCFISSSISHSMSKASDLSSYFLITFTTDCSSWVHRPHTILYDSSRLDLNRYYLTT